VPELRKQKGNVRENKTSRAIGMSKPEARCRDCKMPIRWQKKGERWVALNPQSDSEHWRSCSHRARIRQEGPVAQRGRKSFHKSGPWQVKRSIFHLCESSPHGQSDHDRCRCCYEGADGCIHLCACWCHYQNEKIENAGVPRRTFHT
jgi:hypothetical protein